MKNVTLESLAAHANPWKACVVPFLGPFHAVVEDCTDRTGVAVDLPSTLFLRSHLAGFTPPGRTSANGSCRLFESADGWTAVNFARPDNHASLPVLLSAPH